MTARSWLRTGLVLLAVTQGLAGAVQLLLPKVFFERFPLPTSPWVSMLPPYNEHLMRDVGAGTLAYVVVLTVAAVTLHRLVVRTALVANLAFTVPHFVFHALHLAHFSLGDAIGQTTALGLGVALPVALLAISGAAPDGSTTPGAGGDRPSVPG